MVDTGNRVRDNLVVSGAVILLQMAIQIVNSIVQAVWTAVCGDTAGGGGDSNGKHGNIVVRYLLQWFWNWDSKDTCGDGKTPQLIDHRKVQTHVDETYEYVDQFFKQNNRFVWRVHLSNTHNPADLLKAWLGTRTTNYIMLPSKRKYFITPSCADMQPFEQQTHIGFWFDPIATFSYWSDAYFPIYCYVNKEQHKQYVYARFILMDTKFEIISADETYGIQCYNEFYQFCKNNEHLCETVKPQIVDYPPDIYTILLKADGVLITSDCCFTAKKITFQNLSFDDKPLLLDWLSRFKQGSVYPAKLNMSNKLGILLYGPPGTGKSACAVAIAHYLGRRIYTIDNSIIQAGFNKFVKYFSDNSSNSVHVFDEFDAFVKQLILNELAQKRDKTEPSEMEQYTTMLAIMAERANKNKDNEATDCRGGSGTVDYSIPGKTRPLTITDFIRALDSIYNDSGRIIVATTNHISELSSVLLRPGRFDLKIEMGYCSANMVTDILSMDDRWAASCAEICPEIITRIVKMKVTPLVLINSMLQCNHTPDNLLEKIRRNLKFDCGAHQKKSDREVAPFVDVTADDDNLSSDDTQSM